MATLERFELPFSPRKGDILGQLDERVGKSIANFIKASYLKGKYKLAFNETSKMQYALKSLLLH